VFYEMHNPKTSDYQVAQTVMKEEVADSVKDLLGKGFQVEREG